MENVNYTKFSEEQKVETPVVEEVVEPVIEEEVIEEPVIEEVEIEEEEVVEEPKEVKGVVVNCGRLNVRKEADPNAAVLKIINSGAKVKIDEEGSTDDFYKVQVAGFTGFCMKEFIEVE